MALSPGDVAKLRHLIALAQDLLARAEPVPKNAKNGAARAAGKRTRRTGKELVTFRRMLKSERRKGVPVEELARAHGISSAYIYQIG